MSECDSLTARTCAQDNYATPQRNDAVHSDGRSQPTASLRLLRELLEAPLREAAPSSLWIERATILATGEISAQKTESRATHLAARATSSYLVYASII